MIKTQNSSGKSVDKKHLISLPQTKKCDWTKLHHIILAANHKAGFAEFA